MVLVISEGDGNRLQCLDGHFLCNRQEFERLWDVFSRGGPSSWSDDAVNKLFEDLKALNLVEVPA